MSGREQDNELSGIEQALGSLTPAAAGIDRDALMFNAGLAAGGRHARAWRRAALGMACVCLLAIGVLRSGRPAPPAPGRAVVVVRDPAPPLAPVLVEAVAGRSSSELRRDDYLALRNRLLADGLDGLPEPSAAWVPDRPIGAPLLDLPGLARDLQI